MKNAINWFEIPVTDFSRATHFYKEILSTEIGVEEMGPFLMGMLPYQDGVGGALVKAEGYTPNPDGCIVYLNGGEDLNQVLSKVENSGGKVVMPKTKVNDEVGYISFFIDSEGNKIGVHSQN
jgi:predicted enzyme related to lactoylglutathione lyase